MIRSIKNFSTNLGLAATPETTDPKNYAEFVRIYNAVKALAINLDLYTGNPPNILEVTASVAIAYGDLVDLYNVAGVLTARKADATDHTKPCKGFCSAPGGIANGVTGEISIRGYITVSGVTPGTIYYLNTTAGQMVGGKPGGAGNLVQPIGFGIDSTAVYFAPELSPV